MSLLQAVVLAVVQGLTEFLPISSTAHLILVPWLFGWPDPGLTYDVALHAGTLLAVLAYFARTWMEMLLALLRRTPSPVAANHASVPPTEAADGRLLWFIVLATLPGALAGYFLESHAETLFRRPALIGVMLIGVAWLMWVADRRPGLTRTTASLSLTDALTVGLAQAVAVVPGTSRAGITIAAGLFRNLRRESAARFSFMLATPIIAGATLKKGLEIGHSGLPAGVTGFDFAVGFVVSAVVGYAAIAFLLRYLRLRTLKIFVAYRLALGGIILAGELLRSLL